MNFFYSLRFRLYILCFISFIIPMSVTIFMMSAYYQNLISAETKASTESTLLALTKNIETYFDDLERITLTPYTNQNLLSALPIDSNLNLIDSLAVIDSKQYDEIGWYEKLQLRNYITSSLFNCMQNTRKDILCCLIATNNENAYIMTKYGLSNSPPNFSFAAQPWYKKSIAADGKAVFINAHPQDYNLSEQNKQVFSVARLLKDPTSQRPLGVIMADADTIILKNIFDNVKFNVSSIISIVDENNNLIYSNGDLSPSMLDQVKHQSPRVQGKNEQYELVTRPIDRVNWKMVVLLSSSEIRAKLKLAYFIGFLFASGISVFTFLVFSSLAKLITNPFKQLTHFIKQVEKGHLNITLKMKGRDEISNIGNALDKMVFQLNELINREYKAALNIRNAEFYALQSQINPHFLYNTLTGFLGLNRLKQTEILEKSIIALTGLMRYTLEHREFARIADEFLFLERYCSLQKLRFGDRLEYNLSYDEKMAGYKIPKLILQPLVENSVIHGIESLDGIGIIHVNAVLINRNDDSFLEISVKDNGVGFDADSMVMDKSVGLLNVKDRLVLSYPDSTFSISSQKGHGTEILIEIPEKDVM